MLTFINRPTLPPRARLSKLPRTLLPAGKWFPKTNFILSAFYRMMIMVMLLFFHLLLMSTAWYSISSPYRVQGALLLQMIDWLMMFP